MSSIDLRVEEARLKNLASDILADAKAHGADSCELQISLDQGLQVSVRMGEVESIEHTKDRSLSITVYKSGRKGSASSSDFSPKSLRAAVENACAIAQHTEADALQGLADAERMAKTFRDLHLWHPQNIDPELAIEFARRCEAAGLEQDSRLENSEGASFQSNESYGLYANSHNFFGFEAGTSFSLSAALVGVDGESMERDYDYDSARAFSDMRTPELIGREAARRTLARLNPRQLKTLKAPVLLSPELARGLIGHLCGAVSGTSQYRKSSFLLGSAGTKIFPEWMQIHEDPFVPKAFGSCNFDAEGVEVRAKAMIDQGVLTSYQMGSYSARKLGLESTGHAGGIHNLRVQANGGNLQSMLQAIGSGLFVTELMGQGVNNVTGDYSRGAAGYWIENGEIAFPVSELTIAGNLKSMFQDLVAIGTDIDRRGTIEIGSTLLAPMMIAGQ